MPDAPGRGTIGHASCSTVVSQREVGPARSAKPAQLPRHASLAQLRPAISPPSKAISTPPRASSTPLLVAIGFDPPPLCPVSPTTTRATARTRRRHRSGRTHEPTPRSNELRAASDAALGRS